MGIIKNFKDFFSFRIEDPLFPQGFLDSKSLRSTGPRFEPVYRLSYDPARSVQVDLLVNGESVKTSLIAREIYLNEHSKKERQAREQAMILAMEYNSILTKDAARSLRKAEENKRLEACCQILEMKRASRQHDSD